MSQSLLEQIGLPEAEHIIYNNPPLVLVLCQVQFTPVLSVSNPSYVAGFQQHIQDEYPISQQAKEVQITLGEGGISTNFPGNTGSLQWQFSDEHNNWNVILTNNYLTLEARAYQNFTDFLHRFQRIIEALQKYIKPKIVTRIGLRYIDEIRTTLDFSKVIRQNMLGPLSANELKGKLEASVHRMVLQYKSNQKINIAHGLFPTGSVVEPKPNSKTPNEKFYLLDIDIYREFAVSERVKMSADYVCEIAAEYNKVAYQFFRWFLSDEYLSSLEVRQ